MMEAEGTFARMERTLWTVWCFISEAMNRLLRPQPAPGVGNEQNPCLEAAGEGEPPESGDAEVGIETGEDPLVTGSLLNPPQTAADREHSVAEAGFQPDEDTVQQENPPSKCSEGKESEEDAEKQLEPAGCDDAELLITEDTNKHEKEETQSRPLLSYQEISEEDKCEQHVDIRSETLTDHVISEKIKESEEETVAIDDHQETRTTVQLQTEDDDKTPEHEQECETTDSEGGQRTITHLGPEENNSLRKEDTEPKCEGKTVVLAQEEAGITTDVLQVDQKIEADEETAQVDNQLMPPGDFIDVVDVEKHVHTSDTGSENDESEEEAGWSLDKREQRDVTEEENISDDVNDECVQTLREDGQEEKASSEHAACGDSPVEGERLYSVEFTEKEPETLAVAQVQTNTRQTDVKLRDDAADLRCTPEDQAEETFCVTEDGKEGFVEIMQTTSAAAVKLEGETGWEISRELGSIPLGTSEGRIVVLEELNAPACEETQEGLPENNNELGQDENTTPRFLEVDYKEFQSVQLPEEVESHEQESPPNTEAACLLMSESVEEKPEGTGDTATIVDLTGIEQIGTLPLLNVESPQETEKQLSEEAVQDFDCPLKTELLESPMKTEVTNLRMVDGTESNLLGFGIDEVPTSKEVVQSIHEVEQGAPAGEVTDEILKSGGEDMTQTSLSQEVLHSTLYRNSSSENVSSPECQTHSAESVAEVQNDGVLEKLDADDYMEEHEMRGKTESGLLAPMPGELITSSEGEENAVVKQSVLSTQVETGEIKNQFPHRTFEIETKEISNNETTDDLTITQSRAEDLSDMSAGESAEHVTESKRWDTEGSSSSISGSQDPIDEEILDLWIETAMSFSNQPNSQDGSMQGTQTPGTNLLNKASTSQTGAHPGLEIITTGMDQNSKRSQEEEMQKERLESAETETGLKEEANDATGKQTEEADVMMNSLTQDELLEMSMCDSSDQVTQSKSGLSRSGSEASSEEGFMWTKHCSQGDVSKNEKEEFDILSVEEQPFGHSDESSPSGSEGDVEPITMLEDQTELVLSIQVDAPVLDFTPQRSRISLKNPRVRPPNNPRYLLNMPSLEPTSTSPAPLKLPAGVPLGALGSGIKLPGLAAGFPLLKKTQRMVKDEDRQETPSQQEAETMSEDTSVASKKEEEPHKPKWTPPKHPGFGNPLMSELKTKLKKTSNE